MPKRSQKSIAVKGNTKNEEKKKKTTNRSIGGSSVRTMAGDYFGTLMLRKPTLGSEFGCVFIYLKVALFPALGN
jgi:hypothetical protein